VKRFSDKRRGKNKELRRKWSDSKIAHCALGLLPHHGRFDGLLLAAQSLTVAQAAGIAPVAGQYRFEPTPENAEK